MNLYNRNSGINNSSSVIDMRDLDEFTKQLGDFLNLYRKKVYIERKEDIMTLETLELIHMKLENHQFDDLINDTSIITIDTDK